MKTHKKEFWRHILSIYVGKEENLLKNKIIRKCLKEGNETDKLLKEKINKLNRLSTRLVRVAQGRVMERLHAKVN